MGDAYKRLEASSLQELIVTDTIPLTQECSKIRVVSSAELFADVLKSVNENRSITSKFII